MFPSLFLAAADVASAATEATTAAASSEFHINLGNVDYVILTVYFLFVIGIGIVLKRFTKTGADFLTSGRAIPAWICGLAFISANLGAQEVMGMAAQGAKYGIMTSHFYWVGAIPAMVFIGIFMMPFYYGSKARSVPEYLKLRFDEKTRGFNAISFAVMTIFSSGVSMMVLAKLLSALLGWNFHACVFASAAIVLVYIFMGGLTSAIYNEVLQFFLIVLGFLPLTILGLKGVGGWDGLMAKLDVVSQSPLNSVGKNLGTGTWSHSWSHMANVADNPMGVEWIGMVFGLGFVLSFGYWCTDFLVVQRAMAADSMVAARRTPLIAAIPKMLFPALVILPGMVAIALHVNDPRHNFLPLADPTDPTKGLDYNMAMPVMLGRFFPPGVLGLGLTALMASFMSGMAGNVTAFNTIFTYDIYQSYVAKGKPDSHYLMVGRLTTVWGILLSIAAVYFVREYNSLMDVLQLVFSYVNAPLFATFLLGMFWRRTTGHGAFWGLLCGTLGCAIHHGLTLPAGSVAGGPKGGWLCFIDLGSPVLVMLWALFLALFGIALIHLARSEGANNKDLRVIFGKIFLYFAPVIAVVNLGLSILPHGQVVHEYHSEMALNFYGAMYAFSACFIVTILVSLLTRRVKTDEDLKGLVYSLTPKIKDRDLLWYQQPATLGIVVLVATVILNWLFW